MFEQCIIRFKSNIGGCLKLARVLFIIMYHDNHADEAMVRIHVSWLFGRVNILLSRSENRAHDALLSLRSNVKKRG
jgi:hypothetical protein